MQRSLRSVFGAAHAMQAHLSGQPCLVLLLCLMHHLLHSASCSCLPRVGADNSSTPKPLRGWDPARRRNMDYQLVIKFWRRSLQEEAFLSTIQDELKEVLGPG